MNETSLWCCNICEKTIISKSKSKHNKSKSHKHKQKYEFIHPDIDSVNYILNDTIKDCRKNYFHPFEYRNVYDIKITNIRNNKGISLSITLEKMNFKSQFYGLSKIINMQETMVLYLMK